jgi:hypothetical protein
LTRMSFGLISLPPKQMSRLGSLVGHFRLGSTGTARARGHSTYMRGMNQCPLGKICMVGGSGIIVVRRAWFE